MALYPRREVFKMLRVSQYLSAHPDRPKDSRLRFQTLLATYATTVAV
jgi:hypothetical protein